MFSQPLPQRDHTQKVSRRPSRSQVTVQVAIERSYAIHSILSCPNIIQFKSSRMVLDFSQLRVLVCGKHPLNKLPD